MLKDLEQAVSGNHTGLLFEHSLATASKTLNDKPLVPVSLFEDPQLKVA